MTSIDFLHDEQQFTALWQRAMTELESVCHLDLSAFLFFDSVDIQTQKLFELIRHLLAAEGATDFATLVLNPDPYSYFHFHFGKYPGFIHRADNSDDEFFEFMMADPGGNPADAIGVNSYQYVVLPLPGDWILFGDRWWEVGLLYGPPHIMKLARDFYPFFLEPPERFRLEPYRHSPQN